VLNIQARDVDNALPSSHPERASLPDQDQAMVHWSPPPGLTKGDAGPDQQTVDLSSVIQEVVDGKGWASGNGIVIIITGNGRRIAVPYDGEPIPSPAFAHRVYDAQGLIAEFRGVNCQQPCEVKL